LSYRAREARKKELLARFENANIPEKEPAPSYKNRQDNYVQKAISETAEMRNNMYTSKIAEMANVEEHNYNVKVAFLSEAIMYIYKSIKDPELIDESGIRIARAYVNEFVNNIGPEKLLRQMESTSLMLSEMAVAINSAINECDGAACSDAEKEEEKHDAAMKVDPVTKDKFFDDLSNTADVQDTADSIKSRVSDAMTDFINKTNAAKVDIEDVVNDIKEKVDSSTSEEVKEAYQASANKRINMINENMNLNILGKIIHNMTESAYTNADMRRVYTENGIANLPKITHDAKCIYAVMEMFNTAKLEKYTPEKIAEFVNSFK
jgi:hypothetical protein